MGIPVVDGGTLRPDDDARAPLVALVNESAARAYGPDGDAVDARIHPLFAGPDTPPVRVVGVAADVYPDGNDESSPTGAPPTT